LNPTGHAPESIRTDGKIDPQLKREINRECGTVAELTLYCDHAIHRFNDGSAGVETQPEPSIVSVGHRALETSKDARLVFGGDADALVLHRQLRLLGACL
jgi:hypothetical protein